ncbi:MAG TPA: BMP family ABC transporter substrate-binding protein [Alphaproteobacteria bacterium]|nr:BMP family ABC transporter substrate-binding protein [Alphaproteobacteria bacterium]
MNKLLQAALAAGALCAVASVAAADPAVVYDAGGKFDKSFNEAAYNGMEKFKTETGVGYLEFEVQADAQREQAFRKMAQKGADPIIGIGFSQESAIKKVAPEFPNTRFVIIDSVVDLPNVQSIVFKEQEGSYLVGVLAALASKTGKVGFVGGMDIPLISRFQCGYAQGAKSVNSGVEVIGNMTGTTPSAWNDPTRGAELAKGQFDRGVDVVFAAAGGTGIGVYQAAKDSGKLAIGVDSNQNYIHPGTMLTSMLKRVDVAVYNSAKAAKDGTWKPGLTVLGLAEQGVDWALDDNNKSLITDDMKAKVEAARADIIAGKVQVHDFMADNSCPN